MLRLLCMQMNTGYKCNTGNPFVESEAPPDQSAAAHKHQQIGETCLGFPGVEQITGCETSSTNIGTSRGCTTRRSLPPRAKTADIINRKERPLVLQKAVRVPLGAQLARQLQLGTINSE